MKLQLSVLCLCALILSASCEEEKSEVLKPRGPRPVEPGFKADKCATEKEWPFCTDDEWGRKCPSGCRVQGLLDQTNHEILKKIEKIRNLLDEGKKLHRSTDIESKNTYNYLRESLVSSTGSDNRYSSLAEQLRQRIVELKIKIDQHLRMLEDVKAQIKTQFLSIQRLEVDIDIKLRSCKGSCASSVSFSLEKGSYETLEKQLDRLDTLKVQSVETVSSLKVLKSRVLKDVNVPSVYKSGASGTESAAQKKTFFGDVGQLQLSLEAEGSTAETAATVSKVSTVCESVHSRKGHTPYGYQRHGRCPGNKHTLCTDEDEDVTCPSGCRLQGFIDEAERDVYEHLNKICEKTKPYKSASSSTIIKTAQFYEEQRKNIVKTYIEELRYAEAAEMLHRNLTLLQKKITELSRGVQMYHRQTEDQINEIQKLEVDIDIKLRACKGSCKQTFDHVPDHHTFRSMQDTMATFHLTFTNQNTNLAKKLKLQPVVRPHDSLTYTKLPFVYSELLRKFKGIEQNQVEMDDELLQDMWNSDGESAT